MKSHFRNNGHLWKKMAICGFLLVQATSFFMNGKGFSWSYPLKEVSKNECRKQHWDTLPAHCKEPLPIISNANYSKYANDPKYRLVYSIMWGGTYNDGWDMHQGGHEGVDFVSSEGTPVYAVEDGVAIKARAQAGYGNVVTIKHTLDNGKVVYSIYGHLSAITIPEGIQVREGDLIGKMGHEGLAYGDHLHFAINTTPDNTYAFWECPDLGKGEIAIGNQGLCRSFLQARTADPIAWIESQGNGININSNNIAVKPATTTTTNTATTTRRRMPMVPMGPTPSSTPVQTPVTSAITQRAMPAAATTTTSQKAISTRIVTTQDVPKNTVATTSMGAQNSAVYNEEFLQKYNIKVTNSFNGSMNVGSSSSLVITITDKNGKPFAGMLPKEITIIPTENILSLSPQVVRLTNSQGKAVVLISAVKAGKTELIISYNMKTLTKVSVNVR